MKYILLAAALVAGTSARSMLVPHHNLRCTAAMRADRRLVERSYFCSSKDPCTTSDQCTNKDERCAVWTFVQHTGVAQAVVTSSGCIHKDFCGQTGKEHGHTFNSYAIGKFGCEVEKWMEEDEELEALDELLNLI